MPEELFTGLVVMITGRHWPPAPIRLIWMPPMTPAPIL
jgi:hypothetical protein